MKFTLEIIIKERKQVWSQFMRYYMLNFVLVKMLNFILVPSKRKLFVVGVPICFF